MDAEALRVKYEMLSGRLDERSLRLCLASDAMALGRGGVSLVARAAGVSRTTIHAGLRELRETGSSSPAEGVADQVRRRIRRPGGGRKPLAETDETLL